jgi:MFS transporter, YNFM family, putative membrane transport protein
MNSQRDVQERRRRSADHGTRDQSEVEPVHGLRQAAMIGIEVAMTSGARARPGSEQAPVLAPLSVLVGSALLVLAQLYLAIPLAPVIGEALGSGGSAAAAAVGTSYALAYGVGFLIFGPLSDRYGRKLILVAGVAVFAVVTAGLAAAASLSAVAVLRTCKD